MATSDARSAHCDTHTHCAAMTLRLHTYVCRRGVIAAHNLCAGVYSTRLDCTSIYLLYVLYLHTHLRTRASIRAIRTRLRVRIVRILYIQYCSIQVNVHMHMSASGQSENCDF